MEKKEDDVSGKLPMSTKPPTIPILKTKWIWYGAIFTSSLLALIFLVILAAKNEELAQERGKIKVELLMNCSTPDPTPTKPRECYEIKLNDPNAQNGIYDIYPWWGEKNESMRVYCDMETANQQWIVIQRRQNGLINFQRYWNEYKLGFGQLDKEFWLGNDQIHQLTTGRKMKIRFDLWDHSNNYAFAEYSSFRILNEANHYRLKISGYSGNSSDCMTNHQVLNNRYFSTRDRDNDGKSGSCSNSFGSGGWWFYSCGYAYLNGIYYTPNTITAAGIVWYYWKGNWYSLKQTEMKLKYV